MNAELEGLASNPALPTFLLDRLVHDPSLASDLADRTDLTPAHVRTLLSHGNSSATYALLRGGLVAPADVPLVNESVALAVTSHPDADPAVARVLAHHPDATVRAELPEWAASLPPDVIELLAADASADVVAELVLFHTTPLRDHHDPEVRSALARSPHTPADVLTSLSSESLARELASNPATPAAVAADLMRWHACRYYLAERTDLPSALYEQLAVELEPGILAQLASNPAVPVAVLRSLAVTRPLRRAVLRNPAVPLDLLVELESASGAELMVASVAAAQADAAGLEELVARHSSGLHPRIAANPLCTKELLHRMALGGSVKTLRVVARHPAATGETLLLCLEDARARHHAAAHPNLPVDKIVELLASESTARSAAANPSLPLFVMERIALGGSG
ncbi:hypothetical protein JNUCC0626_00115 [Lentzea sp. JNUCC 0626]|uniref:hypothetical protein n=1 Tax=Lentzea sp. JNUCC 0626 TaxID=3367513 RepID=UPI0037481316